jgi:hypothetical protein
MGYVPKYIQKRMFPKDAMKKDGDAVKLKIINVITPISADLAPSGNILDYLHAKVMGRELSKDEIASVGISTNGIDCTLGTFNKAGLIAVGQEVIVTFVSEETKNAKVGDQVSFEINVPEVSVNILIERELM